MSRHKWVSVSLIPKRWRPFTSVQMAPHIWGATWPAKINGQGWADWTNWTLNTWYIFIDSGHLPTQKCIMNAGLFITTINILSLTNVKVFVSTWVRLFKVGTSVEMAPQSCDAVWYTSLLWRLATNIRQG